jgi:O-antigen/teichoic acid export membrane protein
MTTVSAHLEALTSDRLLRRNVALNLAGWTLPAVAALISIPLLARGLGPARFGLVAITWAAVGIFSIFDFGLGRALTRLVAERLAVGEKEDLGDLVWSASWMLLGLTSILAVVGILSAPAIVDVVLHVPAGLRQEAVGVIQLLALSIPPLAHGVVLRGVLEAGQRFGRVNQIRVPLGVASYAGPLLAIPLGADARVAVGIIVLSRIVYWLAHIPFLSDIAADISKPRFPRRAAVRKLMHVGGWITVSNIISPMIVQGDRIMVALIFPVAASGWYGAASEVALKQLLFSAALAPVLFSALSAALKTAPERAVELAEQASRVSLLTLLPVAMLLAAFAEPGLHLWLGSAYSPEAGSVLRWLAVAVYVNTIGQVPYFLLQSGVDARAVGLVHLAELPVYFFALFIAATTLGARGVAMVWFGRMAVDSTIMWTIVHRRMPEAREAVGRVARLAMVCLVGVALAALWGATRS